MTRVAPAAGSISMFTMKIVHKYSTGYGTGVHEPTNARDVSKTTQNYGVKHYPTRIPYHKYT